MGIGKGVATFGGAAVEWAAGRATGGMRRTALVPFSPVEDTGDE